MKFLQIFTALVLLFSAHLVLCHPSSSSSSESQSSFSSEELPDTIIIQPPSQDLMARYLKERGAVPMCPPNYEYIPTRVCKKIVKAPVTK